MSKLRIGLSVIPTLTSNAVISGVFPGTPKDQEEARAEIHRVCKGLLRVLEDEDRLYDDELQRVMRYVKPLGGVLRQIL